MRVSPSRSKSVFSRPTSFNSLIYAWLTAGVLDALAASTHAWTRGISPTRVWQYVASGAIGASAYDGGNQTVLLGLLFHFLIAFVAAFLYFRASYSIPALNQNAVIFGVIYGIVVFFFMSRVVVQLSATRKGPFSLSQMLIGILIHIFCVGLPIALIARRSAQSRGF